MQKKHIKLLLSIFLSLPIIFFSSRTTLACTCNWSSCSYEGGYAGACPSPQYTANNWFFGVQYSGGTCASGDMCDYCSYLVPGGNGGCFSWSQIPCGSCPFGYGENANEFAECVSSCGGGGSPSDPGCEMGCCKVPCGESVKGCGDGGITCKKGYACYQSMGCGWVPPTPSCSVSLSPSSSTISVDASVTLLTSSVPRDGTIDSINFYSSNASYVLVSPTSSVGNISNVVATATGITGDTSAVITASVVMSGAVRCSASSTITVLPGDPWWQVQDSDVVANGNLTSKVPSAYLLDLVGSGGFPGAVIYSGTTNLTAAKTSTKMWLANSGVALSKTFNSVYFFNSLPADIVLNEIENPSVDGTFFESGGESYDGYYYYMYDGTSTGLPLNINSAMDLGDRKVILLVKGAGINFGGTVNLTKGTGFFLAVSAGDMTVSSSIGSESNYSFEGIYVTDGSFSTGTLGEESDTQLRVRGSIYAYEGMNLQRDLVKPGNTTKPAEFFEYAPDLELLFPISLSYRPTHWQEVAP